MAAQMVLGVQLPQSATLDAFVGHKNAHVKAAIEQLVSGCSERLFLYGPADTGKTHLLQAACRAAGDDGQRSVYVPLAQVARQATSLLAGLQRMDCVCVDDVSSIAGDRDAEIALLSLSDGLRAGGGRLLAADRLGPSDIGLALADLASRLAWGGALATTTLGDADKLQLLLRRAEQRGMTLPEPTARWLLRHSDSAVSSLMQMLETLDHASLSAHRRLTVPFVKQALADSGLP